MLNEKLVFCLLVICISYCNAWKQVKLPALASVGNSALFKQTTSQISSFNPLGRTRLEAKKSYWPPKPVKAYTAQSPLATLKAATISIPPTINKGLKGIIAVVLKIIKGFVALATSLLSKLKPSPSTSAPSVSAPASAPIPVAAPVVTAPVSAPAPAPVVAAPVSSTVEDNSAKYAAAAAAEAEGKAKYLAMVESRKLEAQRKREAMKAGGGSTSKPFAASTGPSTLGMSEDAAKAAYISKAKAARKW